MGLETHDTSEALAARQCYMGRATGQSGYAVACCVPETNRGWFRRLGDKFELEGLRWPFRPSVIWDRSNMCASSVPGMPTGIGLQTLLV